MTRAFLKPMGHASIVMVMASLFALPVHAATGTSKKHKLQKDEEAAVFCVVNGQKGFRPKGSDTCVVISGYISATVGAKTH